MQRRKWRVAGRTGQADHKSASDGSSRQIDRRGFIASGTTFVGGALSGVVATYLGDYLGIVAPPAEVADQRATDPPARAIVLVERDVSNQGDLWIFPYLLSERPEMLQQVTEGQRNGQELLNIYYTNGAADVNISNLKLIVEGRRNIDIRITEINAVILKRSERLGTGASVLTPGPQGRDDSIKVAFDLDGSDLDAKMIAEPARIFESDGFFGGRAFQTSTVGLARNEQQVFQVVARTLAHYVEWNLEIALLVEGAVEVLTADANGRPFRTCGAYPDPRSGDHTVPDETRYSEVYFSRLFDPPYDLTVGGTFRRVK